MKIGLKKAFVAAVLAGLTAAPFTALADGFNFNVKVGDDNEAHYHFRAHGVRHDPEMFRAAKSLADAKSHLWYAKDDFNGHRTRAIESINMALDEINAAEHEGRHNRDDHR